MKHGKGVEKNSVDKYVYTGDFQQNLKTGKGKFEHNGDFYEGDFVDGSFEG